MKQFSYDLSKNKNNFILPKVHDSKNIIMKIVSVIFFNVREVQYYFLFYTKENQPESTSFAN